MPETNYQVFFDTLLDSPKRWLVQNQSFLGVVKSDSEYWLVISYILPEPTEEQQWHYLDSLPHNVSEIETLFNTNNHNISDNSYNSLIEQMQGETYNYDSAYNPSSLSLLQRLILGDISQTLF
jgi:hypothetical protein